MANKDKPAAATAEDPAMTKAKTKITAALDAAVTVADITSLVNSLMKIKAVELKMNEPNWGADL